MTLALTGLQAFALFGTAVLVCTLVMGEMFERAIQNHFKPTGRRPPLPKGKRDKRTIDMFTGRAGV